MKMEDMIRKKAGELRAGVIRPNMLFRIAKKEIERVVLEYGYRLGWRLFTEKYGVEVPFGTFYGWVRRNVTSPVRPNPTGRPAPASASRPVGAPRGGTDLSRAERGETTDREEKKKRFPFVRIEDYDEEAKAAVMNTNLKKYI